MASNPSADVSSFARAVLESDDEGDVNFELAALVAAVESLQTMFSHQHPGETAEGMSAALRHASRVHDSMAAQIGAMRARLSGTAGLEELSRLDAGSAQPSRQLLLRRGDRLLPLPSALQEVMFDALRILADGDGVMVVPQSDEVTTGEAASMLNVSRPHVVKLIEDGKLACRRVGKHRRLRRADVVQYQRAMRRDQESAMEELGELSAELGLED